jgi:hypothetical protein
MLDILAGIIVSFPFILGNPVRQRCMFQLFREDIDFVEQESENGREEFHEII